MNKTEKMMNERMNFRSHRGRSAAWQRENWLKNLRAERNGDDYKYYVVVNGWATYDARTIRQGKILGLSIVNALGNHNPEWRGDGYLTVEIYDRITMISLWRAER